MLLCYDPIDISDLWEFFKMPVDTGVDRVKVDMCTTHSGDKAMRITTELVNGTEVISNDLYGKIATITYDAAAAEYVMEWEFDDLGWQNRKGQSREALEYIALAYCYELKATGH